MFGRQRRRETEELLRATRERMDASAQQSAVLVDAITALNATMNALAHGLTAQAGDVSAALDHVASTSALLAQRIEADRLDRTALAEAVRQLNRPPALPEPARPRVLGGSMFATPPAGELETTADDDDDDAVDVLPAVPLSVGTAVCCRFGDQWIAGVEIVEIVGHPSRPAHRLRRCQDGYILPALFGTADLRRAEPGPMEGRPDSPGRWTRS